jgi:IS1 family transposase
LTPKFQWLKLPYPRIALQHKGRGDVWTWIAIDAETKLVPCWYVGNRDAGAAYHFMHDLAGRLANRVQLTTDAHRPYLIAVEDAFGTDIDYAQLVKIYGSPESSKYNAEVRYPMAHTSKKDASYASKLLRTPSTPAKVKSVAASDLRQARRSSGGKKK